MASCKTDFSLHPGTLRSDNGNKDFKMGHRFNRQNNNFAHTVHLFYTFLAVTTWLHAEPLISCLEDINLDMLLRNLNPREFAYIRHSELDKLQWRLKEGKFPFLSDVFVACFQTSPFSLLLLSTLCGWEKPLSSAILYLPKILKCHFEFSLLQAVRSPIIIVLSRCDLKQIRF